MLLTQLNVVKTLIFVVKEQFFIVETCPIRISRGILVPL